MSGRAFESPSTPPSPVFTTGGGCSCRVSGILIGSFVGFPIAFGGGPADLANTPEADVIVKLELEPEFGFSLAAGDFLAVPAASVINVLREDMLCQWALEGFKHEKIRSKSQ